MKTLFHAEEIDGKLVLYYLKDYPPVVDGKVKWYSIVPIDLNKGILGQEDQLGNVKELVIETKTLNITNELREKFITKMLWNEVITETGQKMLFPPNFETE